MTESNQYLAYDAVPVSEASQKEIEYIREEFKKLAAALNIGEPKNGRYLALAHTSLEQACMWAIKSVTHSFEFRSRKSFRDHEGKI